MHYTINHKPPHIFEYIVRCNKHDYVFTFVETKENKRLFDLKIGLLQNNRMKKWRFFRSDLKAIFKQVMDLFGEEILPARKDVKAIIIQINSIKDKDGELYWKLLNAIKRKYSSRFKVYKRIDGIGNNYKFLIVRRPYDDTDVFAGKFGDLDTVVEATPKRRVSLIKKVKETDEGKTVKVTGPDDSVIEIPEVVIGVESDMDVENALKIADANPRTVVENIRKHADSIPFDHSKAYWNESKEYMESLSEELSYDELTSLNHYTQNGYRGINKMLRGERSDFVYESFLEDVRNINNAFEKAKPLEAPITVLRSMNVPSTYFRDMGIGEGDLFVDPAFLSTSYKLFSDENVVMRIVVPKGAKVIYMGEFSSYEGELEVLLPAGSVLKFLREEGDGIFTFLYMGNISDVIEEQVVGEVDEQLTEIKNYYEMLEVGDVIFGGKEILKKFSIYDVFVWDEMNEWYDMISLWNKEFLDWARRTEKIRKVKVQEIVTKDLNSLGYGDVVYTKSFGLFWICSNRIDQDKFYYTDYPEMVDFQSGYFSNVGIDDKIVIKNPRADQKPPLLDYIENKNQLRSVLESGNILFSRSDLGNSAVLIKVDNNVILLTSIGGSIFYNIVDIDTLRFDKMLENSYDYFKITMNEEVIVDVENVVGYEKYFVINVEDGTGVVESILGSRIDKEDAEDKLIIKLPSFLL